MQAGEAMDAMNAEIADKGVGVWKWVQSDEQSDETFRKSRKQESEAQEASSPTGRST